MIKEYFDSEKDAADYAKLVNAHPSGKLYALVAWEFSGWAVEVYDDKGL